MLVFFVKEDMRRLLHTDFVQLYAQTRAKKSAVERLGAAMRRATAQSMLRSDPQWMLRFRSMTAIDVLEKERWRQIQRARIETAWMPGGPYYSIDKLRPGHSSAGVRALRQIIEDTVWTTQGRRNLFH